MSHIIFYEIWKNWTQEHILDYIRHNNRLTVDLIILVTSNNISCQDGIRQPLSFTSNAGAYSFSAITFFVYITMLPK